MEPHTNTVAAEVCPLPEHKEDAETNSTPHVLFAHIGATVFGPLNDVSSASTAKCESYHRRIKKRTSAQQKQSWLNKKLKSEMLQTIEAATNHK